MTATSADAPPPKAAPAAGLAAVPVRARRRGVELSLTVAAVLVSVYGYAEVGLATSGRVPPDAAGYGAGLALLAGLAHLAVRARAPYADPLLLPIAVLLNGFGLVLIYRLDLEPSLGARAAPTQLVWSTLGITLFVLVVLALGDHRVLARYSYLGVTAALALMAAPIFFP